MVNDISHMQAEIDRLSCRVSRLEKGITSPKAEAPEAAQSSSKGKAVDAATIRPGDIVQYKGLAGLTVTDTVISVENEWALLSKKPARIHTTELKKVGTTSVEYRINQTRFVTDITVKHGDADPGAYVIVKHNAGGQSLTREQALVKALNAVRDSHDNMYISVASGYTGSVCVTHCGGGHKLPLGLILEFRGGYCQTLGDAKRILPDKYEDFGHLKIRARAKHITLLELRR